MVLNFAIGAPGLLVSVRNSLEALEALAGGADVIDVKEPSRGSLGAADAVTIADVVRAVDDRAPVTAALGELLEMAPHLAISAQQTIPPGVSLFKIGLAGCSETDGWRQLWRQVIERLSRQGSMHGAKPVAVAYADWQAARAPEPELVLRAAMELACPALLVDTWDKSSGPLFAHWSANQLESFVTRARKNNLAAVVAGSLSGETFHMAASLRPNLIAVRSAACESGRNGNVTRQRVQELKAAMRESQGAAFFPASASQ